MFKIIRNCTVRKELKVIAILFSFAQIKIIFNAKVFYNSRRKSICKSVVTCDSYVVYT